jgi:cobalt-zinc-cadmium efflux system outer membrane protein
MRWCGLLLSLAIAHVARAETVRLADVIERVAERGPEQAVAAAQLPIARAEVRTARMLPNPTLLLTGDRSEPIFSASLQLRLPIFGQRGAHVRAAERGVDQASRELTLQRWHLRHDARVAYYGVARADEEVAISIEIEALSRHIHDMAKEKYQVGTGTRLDERQASLVHVRALQDVSDRRALARVARLDLARLEGVPEQTLGALAEPLERFGATPPLEALLDEARLAHPELRAIQAERQAAAARAQAARADVRPAPLLEFGVELLEPATCGNPDGSRCVGPRGALDFDLPVLNLNRGPVERAEAEMHLAELKTQAAQVRIESAVRAVYESLTAAVARARFFDGEYVPNAASVEEMAREGFAAGRTGILPLIEAERAVLDARLGRTEALFAVQAARADLEEASGVALSVP